jgi:hypothetical protein
VQRPLRIPTLAVAVAILAACHETATSPGTPTRTLPTHFFLVGEAATVDGDENSADCALNLGVDLTGSQQRTGGVVSYAATFGGDIDRRVLDRTGAGFGFSVDVQGAMEVRLIGADSVEIAIPANANADGRLYRQLALIGGRVPAAESPLAQGGWTCAPFDINTGGYLDTALVAPGTWHLSLTPDGETR